MLYIRYLFMTTKNEEIMKGLTVSTVILALVILACGHGSESRKDREGKGAEKERSTITDEDPYSNRECLSAIERARQDARIGRYRLTVHGTKRYTRQFAKLLTAYLKDRYSIDLVMQEEKSTTGERCYSNEMDRIIYKKFGGNILGTAENEVKVIYRNN
jgi:hypothetical protein